MTGPEISTLSSRIAYENRWLRLREDQVRHRDGHDGMYGVVELPPFAAVIPWQDGRITLVQQYRYPVHLRLWELPMGTRSRIAKATPTELAAAELREETGLIARTLAHAGELLLGPGFCDQVGHVFLATGLAQSEPAREATEQGMVCQAFSLAEVDAMLRDGLIRDTISVAALGLVRLKGMLA